jgi:hypothetical protein
MLNQAGDVDRDDEPDNRSPRTLSRGGLLSGCPFSLTLREEVLADLGLALQPRQPWILIHSGNRLAGGQSLAHHLDHLAVSSHLLFQGPGWQQVQPAA